MAPIRHFSRSHPMTARRACRAATSRRYPRGGANLKRKRFRKILILLGNVRKKRQSCATASRRRFLAQQRDLLRKEKGLSQAVCRISSPRAENNMPVAKHRIRNLNAAYERAIGQYGTAYEACEALNTRLKDYLVEIAQTPSPSKEDANRILGIGWLPSADNVMTESLSSIVRLANGTTRSASDPVIAILAEFLGINEVEVRAPTIETPGKPPARAANQPRSYGRSGAPKLVVMELGLSPKIAGQNRPEPDEEGKHHISLDVRLFFFPQTVEFFGEEAGLEFMAECRIVSGRLQLRPRQCNCPGRIYCGFERTQGRGQLETGLHARSGHRRAWLAPLPG
jgi:hypothetical protein